LRTALTYPVAYREEDVPDLSGKTYLVTGANSGIGFETCRVLAGRGARVLLGCRSDSKADQACERIRAVHPDASVAGVVLDLADLSSIRRAATQVAQESRLDVLINNAGLMIPPRTLTADGFESQFGVNHLGHFALTGLLLAKLAEQDRSRVVTVSSNAHKFGKIDFDDVAAERKYKAGARYAMSKLANLMFTFELQRRLDALDSSVMAVACHPGGADTELARHVPELLYQFIQPLARLVINSAAEGALPTLRAATDPGVASGEYFGPARLFETVRSAVLVQPGFRALDRVNAERLWALSVQLTGIDPFQK